MRASRLLSLLIVGILVGCRSDVDHAVNPKPGVEVETARTHVPQFNDVPVPEGYVVRPGLQGYITEAGSFRAGRQFYAGDGRPLDAVAYFEERMPHHGWTLVDRGTSADGLSFMLWRKSSTAVQIEISPGAKGRIDLEVRMGTSLDPNYRP